VNQPNGFAGRRQALGVQAQAEAKAGGQQPMEAEASAAAAVAAATGQEEKMVVLASPPPPFLPFVAMDQGWRPSDNEGAATAAAAPTPQTPWRGEGADEVV